METWTLLESLFSEVNFSSEMPQLLALLSTVSWWRPGPKGKKVPTNSDGLMAGPPEQSCDESSSGGWSPSRMGRTSLSHSYSSERPYFTAIVSEQLKLFFYEAEEHCSLLFWDLQNIERRGGGVGSWEPFAFLLTAVTCQHRGVLRPCWNN